MAARASNLTGMDQAKQVTGVDQAEDGSAGGDWASRVTHWVDAFVQVVQQRSVQPVLFALRALVVGTFVAIVAVFLFVAASIGIVRLLTEDVFNNRVWASDLLLGGIFAGAGAFLLKLSGGGRRSDDVDK